MKIRNKLTFSYSLSTIGVLLALSFFIYFYSRYFHQEQFFNRLDERLEITGEWFMRAPDLPPSLARELRDRFMHQLDSEREVAFPLSGDPSLLGDSLSGQFPETFLLELEQVGLGRYREGDRMGVGRVVSHEGTQWVLIVDAVDVLGQSNLDHLRTILVTGVPISVIMIVLLGWLVVRNTFRPLSRKIERARKIGASNLHERLQVFNKNDEIGQLAITFNALLDRLELAFELHKKFISNASHEMRNPLAAIIGEAEVTLEKVRSPEEYQQALVTIRNESNRLNDLVTNLLYLAKTDFDQRVILNEEVQLDELMLEVKKELDFRVPDNQVMISFPDDLDDTDKLVIRGNRNLLRSTFLNMLENACKFSDNQPVVFNLRQMAEQWLVEIIDRGIGIPVEDISQILQPFYRAKNARSYKGFGIGLSLSEKVIRLHKGELRILSGMGEGTTMRVLLPIPPAAPVSPH